MTRSECVEMHVNFRIYVSSVVYWLARVAGSNPAEVMGFYGDKKPQRAYLRSGIKP
jgi:hypothetical protein